MHVFGATSLPGCSNYALKRTSLDYKETCGSKVSDTSSRTFYFDDLLKSIKSEKEAIELIKDAKLMYKSGGFNLTKFSSNSKQALETVSACDRRKSCSMQVQ